MSEPLTFRSRCDTTLFPLLAFGVVVGINLLANHDVLKHLAREHSEVGAGIFAVVLTCVLGAAGVFAVSRQSILVNEEGLTHRWLFGTTKAAWHEVREARLPGGGLFWAPTIQLRLDRPRPKFWSLSRGRRRWLVFGSDYEGFERLLGEVLARVPHATVSASLRAYLRSPNDVAWRHRLPTLLALGANAGALAWLLDLMLSGSASGRPWLYAVALLGALCGLPMIGGPLAREWRWKPPLVTAYGFVAPVTCGSLVLSAIFGRGDVFLPLVAACLACALATLLICLPWRPRGWQAVGLYAAVIAALVGWTRWRAGAEPIPWRVTEGLMPGPWHVAWSADGQWVCGMGRAAGEEQRWVCHVVDSRSLQVTTWPLPRCGFGHVMPDARRVLYRATQAAEGEEKPLLYELWALDTASGEAKRLQAAPSLSITDACALSPDRGQLVFLAGPEPERRAVHVLRVDDLSVRRLEVGLDFARVSRALWRSDGQLLLVEEPERKDSDKTVAFWALPPDGGAAACLYRKPSVRDNADVSPNGRWAIVWTAEGIELVDLMGGKHRAIEARPGWRGQSSPHWSPDGETFAFPDHDGRTLVVVNAATGEASRPYSAPDGNIGHVALSRGARYALCAVDGDLGIRARIVDVASGHATTLRRWMNLAESMVPRAHWSPVEQTLLLAGLENLLHPEWPTRLRFYYIRTLPRGAHPGRSGHRES